jgi:hypothetical protein
MAAGDIKLQGKDWARRLREEIAKQPKDVQHYYVVTAPDGTVVRMIRRHAAVHEHVQKPVPPSPEVTKLTPEQKPDPICTAENVEAAWEDHAARLSPGYDVEF